MVSGPLMLWLAYDLGQMGGAFWIKMALVLALIANIVVSKRSARLADAGDAAVAARIPALALIGVGLMLALLASAVVAFR